MGRVDLYLTAHNMGRVDPYLTAHSMGHVDLYLTARTYALFRYSSPLNITALMFYTVLQ
jgi:hypothetical protein